METSYYSEAELTGIGLKKYGSNVQISRKVSIYGAEKISVGDHVRIDDFCVLSGNISLGNYVHIAVCSALFGGSAGIIFHDFSSVSSRCVIYALSDDFSGKHMTNPTIPDEYLGVIDQPVIIEKHVVIGSGTTILPGVIVGEGSAVGSMSLVNKSLEKWGIYAGIPCQYKKTRSKKLLDMEKKLMTTTLKKGLWGGY